MLRNRGIYKNILVLLILATSVSFLYSAVKPNRAEAALTCSISSITRSGQSVRYTVSYSATYPQTASPDYFEFSLDGAPYVQGTNPKTYTFAYNSTHTVQASVRWVGTEVYYDSDTLSLKTRSIKVGTNCGSRSYTMPPAPDASACVSYSVDTPSIAPGANFQVTIKVRNEGTNTWTYPTWKLGADSTYAGTNNFLGADRAGDPGGVAPGGTATYVITRTAPATVGTYNYQWRMVHEAVAWFGPICGGTITVALPTPAVSCNIIAPGPIEINTAYFPKASIVHGGPLGAPSIPDATVTFKVDGNTVGTYGPANINNGQTINPASSSGGYSSASPGTHTVTAQLTGTPGINVACGAQTLRVATFPYLKVYGGDVSAGGAFQGSSGTCSSPNINATINAYAGVVGSEYIGSSAQFGITALMNINGFYSAGTRPSLSPRPPIGLTFSNATGVGDTTYGGAFGGTGNCITDYYNNTQDPDIQTAASFPPTSSPVVTTYGSNNAPTMADIRWSSSGTIAGWNCVNMNEGSAPAAYTWSNNYVCTPNGIGLRWSSAGVIAGMYCVQINEPSEPAAYTWTDNYLCTPTDIGLRWSSAGVIAGMTCTQFNEPSDPYTWTDNYLCEPADITASSSYPDFFGYNYAAANANDAPATNDWASNGQGAGAWIQYNWTTPTKVAKVTIRDRTNPTDNIAGLTLSFSDGSSVLFGALPSDGTPQDITFPERTVTWMRMTVTSVSAGTLNVGVTEMSTHAVASTSGGIAGFAAGRTQYVLSVGDKSLGSLIIPAGSQVAVYVAGDLYLTGDITYDTASRATTKDIPYMAFIVKGNIYVSPSVSRLDGLYIAQPNNPATPTDGRIYTCAPPQGSSPKYYSLSNLYDNCNGKQLVVNGALVAQQIKFMRTINTLNQATANEIPNFADGSNTKAGEVINYTPEMYLAPSPLKDPNSPSSSSRVQPYDAIFSLPPVF